MSHVKQTHYQTVVDCTYWPVLGLLNYWNIIQFTNKTTLSKEFYDIHEVVIDGISDNIAPLVSGQDGAISITDQTTTGYCVVKYVSYDFILQEYVTTYGQVSKAGELAVRSE